MAPQECSNMMTMSVIMNDADFDNFCSRDIFVCIFLALAKQRNVVVASMHAGKKIFADVPLN